MLKKRVCAGRVEEESVCGTLLPTADTHNDPLSSKLLYWPVITTTWLYYKALYSGLYFSMNAEHSITALASWGL